MHPATVQKREQIGKEQWITQKCKKLICRYLTDIFNFINRCQGGYKQILKTYAIIIIQDIILLLFSLKLQVNWKQNDYIALDNH